MDVWCVCVCSFCDCVVLCLGRGLATSWSLVQGVLPSVKWSWNWKAEVRAQRGCRVGEKKLHNVHLTGAFVRKNYKWRPNIQDLQIICK
jgi:hypothetical protein